MLVESGLTNIEKAFTFKKKIMEDHFHSGGSEEELKLEITEYRRKLVKTYGDSFLMSIWISVLVSRRKYQLKYQNLREVSRHY